MAALGFFCPVETGGGVDVTGCCCAAGFAAATGAVFVAGLSAD
jgi:hypothetical protein